MLSSLGKSLTALYNTTSSGVNLSPKAILASYLSKSFGEFFNADSNLIETNLIEDAHVVLRNVQLKPRILDPENDRTHAAIVSALQQQQQQEEERGTVVNDDDANNYLVLVEGSVDTIEFSWKWGSSGGNLDKSNTLVAGGLISDVKLMIRGVRIRLLPQSYTSSKIKTILSVELMNQTKSSHQLAASGVASTTTTKVEKETSKKEGTLSSSYGSDWKAKYMQQIIDHLTLSVDDVEIVIDLPPKEQQQKDVHDTRSATSIVVCGKSIEISTLSNQQQQQKIDPTVATSAANLRQRLSIGSLSSYIRIRRSSLHQRSGDNHSNSDEDETYPLLDPLGYRAEVKRVSGRRFLDGIGTGLIITGQHILPSFSSNTHSNTTRDSNSNKINMAKDDICFHMGLIQVNALIRLQMMLMIIDDSNANDNNFEKKNEHKTKLATAADDGTSFLTTTTRKDNKNDDKKISNSNSTENLQSNTGATGTTSSRFILPIQSICFILNNNTEIKFKKCTIKYRADGSEFSIYCGNGINNIFIDNECIGSNNTTTTDSGIENNDKNNSCRRWVIDMVKSQIRIGEEQQQEINTDLQNRNESNNPNKQSGSDDENDEDNFCDAQQSLETIVSLTCHTNQVRKIVDGLKDILPLVNTVKCSSDKNVTKNDTFVDDNPTPSNGGSSSCWTLVVNGTASFTLIDDNDDAHCDEEEEKTNNNNKAWLNFCIGLPVVTYYYANNNSSLASVALSWSGIDIGPCSFGDLSIYIPNATTTTAATSTATNYNRDTDAINSDIMNPNNNNNNKGILIVHGTVKGNIESLNVGNDIKEFIDNFFHIFSPIEGAETSTTYPSINIPKLDFSISDFGCNIQIDETHIYPNGFQAWKCNCVNITNANTTSIRNNTSNNNNIIDVQINSVEGELFGPDGVRVSIKEISKFHYSQQGLHLKIPLSNTIVEYKSESVIMNSDHLYFMYDGQWLSETISTSDDKSSNSANITIQESKHITHDHTNSKNSVQQTLQHLPFNTIQLSFKSFDVARSPPISDNVLSINPKEIIQCKNLDVVFNKPVFSKGVPVGASISVKCKNLQVDMDTTINLKCCGINAYMELSQRQHQQRELQQPIITSAAVALTQNTIPCTRSEKTILPLVVPGSNGGIVVSNCTLIFDQIPQLIIPNGVVEHSNTPVASSTGDSGVLVASSITFFEIKLNHEEIKITVGEILKLAAPGIGHLRQDEPIRDMQLHFKNDLFDIQCKKVDVIFDTASTGRKPASVITTADIDDDNAYNIACSDLSSLEIMQKKSFDIQLNLEKLIVTTISSPANDDNTASEQYCTRFEDFDLSLKRSLHAPSGDLSSAVGFNYAAMLLVRCKNLHINSIANANCGAFNGIAASINLKPVSTNAPACKESSTMLIPGVGQITDATIKIDVISEFAVPGVAKLSAPLQHTAVTLKESSLAIDIDMIKLVAANIEQKDQIKNPKIESGRFNKMAFVTTNPIFHKKIMANIKYFVLIQDYGDAKKRGVRCGQVAIEYNNIPATTVLRNDTVQPHRSKVRFHCGSLQARDSGTSAFVAMEALDTELILMLTHNSSKANEDTRLTMATSIGVIEVSEATTKIGKISQLLVPHVGKLGFDLADTKIHYANKVLCCNCRPLQFLVEPMPTAAETKKEDVQKYSGTYLNVDLPFQSRIILESIILRRIDCAAKFIRCDKLEVDVMPAALLPTGQMGWIHLNCGELQSAGSDEFSCLASCIKLEAALEKTNTETANIFPPSIPGVGTVKSASARCNELSEVRISGIGSLSAPLRDLLMTFNEGVLSVQCPSIDFRTDLDQIGVASDIPCDVATTTGFMLPFTVQVSTRNLMVTSHKTDITSELWLSCSDPEAQITPVGSSQIGEKGIKDTAGHIKLQCATLQGRGPGDSDVLMSNLNLQAKLETHGPLKHSDKEASMWIPGVGFLSSAYIVIYEVSTLQMPGVGYLSSALRNLTFNFEDRTISIECASVEVVEEILREKSDSVEVDEFSSRSSLVSYPVQLIARSLIVKSEGTKGIFQDLIQCSNLEVFADLSPGLEDKSMGHIFLQCSECHGCAKGGSSAVKLSGLNLTSDWYINMPVSIGCEFGNCTNFPGIGSLMKGSLTIDDFTKVEFDGVGSLISPLRNTVVNFENQRISIECGSIEFYATNLSASETRTLEGDNSATNFLPPFPLDCSFQKILVTADKTFDCFIIFGDLEVHVEPGPLAALCSEGGTLGVLNFRCGKLEGKNLGGSTFTALDFALQACFEPDSTLTGQFSVPGVSLPSNATVTMKQISTFIVPGFGKLSSPVLGPVVRLENNVLSVECTSLELIKYDDQPAKETTASNSNIFLPIMVHVAVQQIKVLSLSPGMKSFDEYFCCHGLDFLVEPFTGSKLPSGLEHQNKSAIVRVNILSMADIEYLNIVRVSSLSASTIIPIDKMDTFYGLKIELKDPQIRADFSSGNWSKKLQTDNKDSQKLKLPLVRVEPMEITLQYNGKMISLSDTVLHCDLFTGSMDTDTDSLQSHYINVVKRRIAYIFTKTDVMGVNIGDSIGTVAGQIAMNATVAGGVAGIALRDGVGGTISQGKASRGVSTTDKYQFGDFSRGIVASVKSAAKAGSQMRGDDKYMIGDFTAGAVAGASKYTGENRERLGGAAGSGLGMVAGAALLGPVGLIAGSVLGAKVAKESVKAVAGAPKNERGSQEIASTIREVSTRPSNLPSEPHTTLSGQTCGVTTMPKIATAGTSSDSRRNTNAASYSEPIRQVNSVREYPGHGFDPSNIDAARSSLANDGRYPGAAHVTQYDPFVEPPATHPPAENYVGIQHFSHGCNYLNQESGSTNRAAWVGSQQHSFASPSHCTAQPNETQSTTMMCSEKVWQSAPPTRLDSATATNTFTTRNDRTASIEPVGQVDFFSAYQTTAVPQHQQHMESSVPPGQFIPSSDAFVGTHNRGSPVASYSYHEQHNASTQRQFQGQSVQQMHQPRSQPHPQPKQAGGYKFGDITRGVVAKGKQARGSGENSKYKFGDFTRGLFKG